MQYISIDGRKKLKSLIEAKQKALADTKDPNKGLIIAATKQTEEYLQLVECVTSAISEANKIIEEYRPKDGITPKKYRDYFTKQEQDEFLSVIFEEVSKKIPTLNDIVSNLLPHIPTPKDGKIPTKKEIKSLIEECMQPVDYDKIAEIVKTKFPEKETEDIKEELEEMGFLENIRAEFKEQIDKIKKSVGTWRGGGDTVEAGTNVTITNLNGKKYINAISGGFTELTATGSVNGVNTAFVFSSKPTYIIADGIWFKEYDTNGGLLWSWNAGTSTATMVNPPVYSIYGVL